MITFKKGDSFKNVDPSSNLIERLINDGWKSDDLPKTINNRASEEYKSRLIERAKELGLNPHHKAGIEKLEAMIKEVEENGTDGA